MPEITRVRTPLRDEELREADPISSSYPPRDPVSSPYSPVPLSSLSSIIGPIVMSQTFGAFEHTIPGAPFFLAAALARLAWLIATRATDTAAA